uniref:RNase H family protein n=1 Tax=Solanum tuberosum TaxID=4113 RepID=M1BA72_SOLTU
MEGVCLLCRYTDARRIETNDNSMWEGGGPIKLKFIYQAVPAIIVWELWKRRNARRNGLGINFYKLKHQCIHTMVQLIKVKYPWIRVPTDWKDIIKVMKEYRPKLHYQAVTWRKPNIGTIKCNSDGTSKGNPGESAYGFCLRDDQGDVR